MLDECFKIIDCSSASKTRDQASLIDLVAGHYTAIVLRNVIPTHYLDHVQDSFYKHRERMETQHYINGKLTTIGPYLARHLDNQQDYFDRAEASHLVLKSVDQYDLPQYVRHCLCTQFNLDELNVAQEADGRRYAEAILRIHGHGISNPLHNDNIMRDAAHTELMVKNLKFQLSCILCIQECDEGGELEHYRKRWEPQDEQHKDKGALGYRASVVEEIKSALFKPKTGDVYLIDPTYYHEIHEVSGKDRVTMGFFLGFFDDQFKKGIVWS